MTKTINELNTEMVGLRSILNEMGDAQKEYMDIQNKSVQLIPKLLGVRDLDEAILVIKKARNAEVHGLKRAALGQTPDIKQAPVVKEIPVDIQVTWGPGRAIPENVRASIVRELKAGVDPWTVSVKHKVSMPSLQKIKAAAGLVKHRS